MRQLELFPQVQVRAVIVEDADYAAELARACKAGRRVFAVDVVPPSRWRIWSK